MRVKKIKKKSEKKLIESLKYVKTSTYDKILANDKRAAELVKPLEF